MEIRWREPVRAARRRPDPLGRPNWITYGVCFLISAAGLTLLRLLKNRLRDRPLEDWKAEVGIIFIACLVLTFVAPWRSRWFPKVNVAISGQGVLVEWPDSGAPETPIEWNKIKAFRLGYKDGLDWLILFGEDGEELERVAVGEKISSEMILEMMRERQVPLIPGLSSAGKEG